MWKRFGFESLVAIHALGPVSSSRGNGALQPPIPRPGAPRASEILSRPRSLTASPAPRRIESGTMKYLTTLEAANDLNVSKQTLLNWLYAGKIPEPPRNPKGYRLWSESRLGLVKKLIAQGRLHTRTVVHRQPSNRPEFVIEYAREVSDYLRDGDIDLDVFLGALARLNPAVGRHRRRGRAPSARPRRAPPPRRPRHR